MSKAPCPIGCTFNFPSCHFSLVIHNSYSHWARFIEIPLETLCHGVLKSSLWCPAQVFNLSIVAWPTLLHKLSG
ncbi:hypothetical protein LXL04_035279 [Taraxacum kok-saghyz]